MPLKGFICESTKKEGAKISFAQCLKCADTRRNDCKNSSEELRGIIDNIQERDMLTGSMLSSCPRGITLQREYDYWIKPSSMYYALRGQMAHKVMKDYAKPRCIVEKRFWAEFNGIILSFQPDLIDVEKKQIWDYKTCEKLPAFRRLRNGKYTLMSFPNHQEQENVYRLGLLECWDIEEEFFSFDIKDLFVYYMAMKDRAPAVSPVWSDKMAQDYIDRYLPMFHYAFTGKVLYKRDWCLSYEDKQFKKSFRWMCTKGDYCPVEQICVELAKKEH